MIPLRHLFVRILVIPLGLGSAAGADWITWNQATDHVVSHTANAAAYPRAKRLSNGEILLGYHHGGGKGEYGTYVTLRHSRDNGVTWYSTTDIEGPEGEQFWGFSNVDFVELSAGHLLVVTAGRGKALPDQPQFESECRRSELRVRMSTDFGHTWGEPVHLAQGRGRVWEPSIVQLPGGELEIYYANEAPELQREGRLDQRIEVIRSLDSGKTWNAPSEIAQHPGMRNGMPAAVVLKDGTVAVAQEMVRDTRSPWITFTSAGRPIRESVPQERYDFGAAPYLLRLPDGGTLLAFHSGFHKQRAPSGTSVPWMFTSIWIQQGDAQCGNFREASQPWKNLDRNKGAFFPGLFMKDDRTVVALGSMITDSGDDKSQTEIHWIEGTLAPPPQPASPQ